MTASVPLRVPAPEPVPAAGAPPKVSFVSLGCPKALVDSERIITQLRAEGYELARKHDGADVVIVDTAGRLHTKANLMEELKKVARTMTKAMDGAPHETLLVLDATNGQNAMQQAAMFKEALPISGIVLTKLDGTAKGGVILGICDELKVPVRFIGIGEKLDDLRPFDVRAFVHALYDDAEVATAA